MVTLHNVECISYIKSLPDKSVDHVISDPPYHERTHAGARSMKNLESSYITFPPMTSELFVEMTKECVRVARRWVILTTDWRFLHLLDEETLVRVGIWVKPNAAPQFSGDRPATGWETVILLHRKGAKTWHGGGHPAVWTYNTIQGGSHPTEKPLPLIKRWLRDFTDEGETVLDPYMGSGTTGVACVQMNRGFVGCEIDPTHFATAEKRILAESSQLKLFPYFDEPRQGDTT